MRRMVLLAICVALVAPGVAQACSKDDATFYETFLDLSCVQAPLNNTTLDALGGLRLATNGAATTTAWDSDTDFNAGVGYQGTTFGPVGVRTLVTNGTGANATLQLPQTLLPLAPDAANPVLRPAPATVGDNDGVDDPTVAKVGTTYVMWYSGTAEDGSGPAIFMATSSDGVAWTRANSGQPVLKGTPGTFDADGVYGPDVIYNPTDATAPYRMYYSGRSGAFGGIGYATSVDGITWLEYKGPAGLIQTPVVDHGPPGSADSFTAADPSVLKDGSVWKMWYTGDDSDKKRIAYATSIDGITWAKGGKVIAPEDAGVSANITFGAFAPTVWKTATGYSMLLTGRKLVSGSTFQTKIQSASSSDGITWSAPSPALNPSGTSSNFDYSNLNSPDLLQDPGSASPYKLYYSGNTLDANGNFHTRIGLAASSDGNSFSKVNGAQTGGSVLDVAAAGTAFDSRQASGLSVAVPGGASPKFAGFYWGTRGGDFIPRLGEATSADGSAWTKMPVAGSGPGGSLFPDAVGSAFDKGGRRDPSILYDAGTYDLYYTAVNSGGTRSIGFASTLQLLGTKLPDNTAWSSRTQVLAPGSGWDAGGVSHPSLVKDGGTYVLYYAGTDSGGTARIGRATSTAPGGPFARDAGNPLLTPGPTGSFDEHGVKDPAVVKLGAGDYRMVYTGVDAGGIERVGYATSADGIAWTKRGVVLNPSEIAYSDDESGVEPTGLLLDGSILHVWLSGVDRTGRTVGLHATTGYPTPSTPTSGIPSGWATYQLGNSSTSVQDFRQITRTSNGGVSLWVSFLQPYSAAGNEFWSDYFPVTTSTTSQTLNFLLKVHGVRWQARLSAPSGAPSVDKIEVTHAPVIFTPTGSATSSTITPSAGRVVTAWKSLTANASLFTPNGGGTGQATVTVLDAGTNQIVASAPLNTAGDTVLDLSSVSAAAHQALQIRFDLQSTDGQATPVVNSFKVLYDSAPSPPPPPPPPVLTLAATPATIVYGKSLTLNGLLTQNGSPLTAQAVTLSVQPIGASTFAALPPPAATSTNGSFAETVKPSKRTTYRASFAGAPDATVTVSVRHLVTLSVIRKGAKVYLRGKIAPAHPKRVVIVQIRKGTRWVSFAKTRTSKRSTFLVAKTLDRRVRHLFRARTGADRDHLAGVSRTVRK